MHQFRRAELGVSRLGLDWAHWLGLSGSGEVWLGTSGGRGDSNLAAREVEGHNEQLGVARTVRIALLVGGLDGGEECFADIDEGAALLAVELAVEGSEQGLTDLTLRRHARVGVARFWRGCCMLQKERWLMHRCFRSLNRALMRCAAHHARHRRAGVGARLRLVPGRLDEALELGVDVLGHRLLDPMVEQLHKRLRSQGPAALE